MANMKHDPKSEPEQKARRVLDQQSPILYTYTTSPIRSLAISSHFDPQSPLIYIGTLSGTVSLLSVNPNANALILLKTLTVVNGTPVVSINIIDSLRKILILAGNSLFLLDSQFSEPVKKLGFIKGGVMAIAKRFKSQNYSSRVDWFLHKPNGVKKVSEVGSTGDDDRDDCVFAVGVGRKLVIVEVNSRGDLVILREIQGGLEGVVGVIVSLVWIDDSVIVGSKSGYYLYSFVNGQCGLICLLPEGCTVPRMKLLRKEGKVLLVVDNVGVIVDAGGQPVGGSLVFRGVPEAVGLVGLYVVVVRDGKVEVYHKKSGSSVQVFKLGIEGGSGPCIMADEEDATGNLVAVATGMKVICYKKVPVEEQIKDLLRKKNFKEALSLVEELESEGEMSKEILSFVHAQVGFLLLFDLHFEDAVHHFLRSETMQPSEVFPFIMRDPNRWSLLVPRNRYWGLHPPPAPLENVVDDGLRSIERAIFLKKAGLETAVDDKFILNRPSRADLMESAIKSMTRYLEASCDKDLTPSVREGVDTLLMYLYRALNRVDDMERLASSENFCVVEELESLLNESGHLRTLAFLYASKGMSSKALAIWRLLARNHASSGQESATGGNGLQDASRNVFVMEAARILEESSDQGLVLQHLGWIADIDQVLAVQVLISDKRVNMLSPDEIIAAIDPKKVEILQRYLQWLIEDQESDDTRFHTTYALLLAKSTLETYELDHASKNSEAGTQSEMNCSGSGRNAIFDSPVSERLQIFLQSSDLYDPEEVLDLIEGSELWLEKAILYRKLGQETLVLQILALKLEDCEAAEQYCAEIGRPDAYMQLLEMYLEPEFGKEPMFKAAVRLLHNHGESLDPLQVLERLSPDMPLHLASETILRMLRARLHHHHQGQIVHNLSRALDVDASLARLDERSRHVVINDESVCDSCNARLGTKLFAMYPDDNVVCYKCFRRQGESTSVTGRDFKEDILYKPGWLVTR